MTTAYLPSWAMSVGVMTLLNVTSLTTTAGCVGGVHNEIVKQGSAYPHLIFFVQQEGEFGGFGTYPGHGDLPRMNLRLQAISKTGFLQADAILEEAVRLLVTSTLTVSGYTVQGNLPFWGDAQHATLEVAGVTEYEAIRECQFYVEETH